MCHDVYVAKRPYVDEFLERVAEKYEVIIFTASLAKVCALVVTCSISDSASLVLTFDVSPVR